MGQLYADITLDQVTANVGIVMAHIPEHIQVIGVVKSDGYGHDASIIAQRLQQAGIDYLAVSDLDEGLALRKNYKDIPILVLGEIEENRLVEAVSKNLSITLSSAGAANRLARIAMAMETVVRVHVNVDTGMGRFGMLPAKVPAVLSLLSKAHFIETEGLFSHLSSTFSNDRDSEAYTNHQLEKFETVCQNVAHLGMLPKMVHIGSSTGLIGFGERVMSKNCTAIRIGTLFLGYEERPSDWQRHVMPVAEIHTRVLLLRDLPPGHAVGYGKTFFTQRNTRLAILPVGYGHGLHRDLGNVGEVLIHGTRFPIIGKPSLGQVMVDVTQMPDVEVGEKVVLVSPAIPAYNEGIKIGRGTWEVLLPMLEHCKKNYL